MCKNSYLHVLHTLKYAAKCVCAENRSLVNVVLCLCYQVVIRLFLLAYKNAIEIY